MGDGEGRDEDHFEQFISELMGHGRRCEERVRGILGVDVGA